MARINIDDELHAKKGFKRLVRKLDDEDKAIGMLYRFWRIAQDYWGKDESLMPLDEFHEEGFAAILEVGLAEQRGEEIYASGAEDRFAWYLQKCQASKGGGRPVDQKKAEARRAVWHAVEKGLLVRPDICSKCGAAGRSIEAHHHDYDKPLDVIWLCRECHRYLHRKRKRSADKPAEPGRISGEGAPTNPPVPVPALSSVPAPDPVTVPNRDNSKTNEVCKEHVDQCIQAWGLSLDRHKIGKDPRLDEFSIARLIQANGVAQTHLALFGAGFEESSEGYDATKHVSIRRLFKPDVFDVFTNLGARELARKEQKAKAAAPPPAVAPPPVEPPCDPQRVREILAANGCGGLLKSMPSAEPA